MGIDKQKNGDGSNAASKDVKITAAKSMEESHLISQILETTPDIIYILDLETTQVIFTSRNVLIDLGYSQDQIASMKNPMFDVMHKDDVPRMIKHFELIRTLSSDHKVVEIDYRLKDHKGIYKWFLDRNTVFNRNSQGIPIEKIGICQDINDEKEREEHNLSVNNIIRQAEQIVDMGSWEYTISSGELHWSDGMYRLFSMNERVSINPKVYLEYCIDDDKMKVKDLIRKICDEHVGFEQTFTIKTNNDTRKILKMKSIVQPDNLGNPCKMIGVDLDITAQVKASQDFHELNQELKKKNEELQRLNSEIRTFNLVAAQDYKETLKQLYTNLEYIITKDAKNLSDSGRANIRRAQASIQKMNLLTDDINQYFDLFEKEFDLELCDVNQVLDKVIEKFTPRLLQISGTIQKDVIPPLMSHPSLFAQLMGNIIDNSIKFHKPSTPLIIHIKTTLANELNTLPMDLKGHNYCIISVVDNGIGFNGQEAENIFDLFYKCKEVASKGAGIGLAVCRQIMSIHKGFISAEGDPSNGASINCYFPLQN